MIFFFIFERYIRCRARRGCVNQNKVPGMHRVVTRVFFRGVLSRIFSGLMVLIFPRLILCPLLLNAVTCNTSINEGLSSLEICTIEGQNPDGKAEDESRRRLQPCTGIFVSADSIVHPALSTTSSGDEAPPPAGNASPISNQLVYEICISATTRSSAIPSITLF